MEDWELEQPINFERQIDKLKSKIEESGFLILLCIALKTIDFTHFFRSLTLLKQYLFFKTLTTLIHYPTLIHFFSQVMEVYLLFSTAYFVNHQF